MKTRIFLMFGFSLLTGILSAQNKPQSTSHEYDFGSEKLTSNVSLNEIAPVAFKHFTQNYPFVKDAVWTRTRIGFAVSGDEVNTAYRYRIFYNQHGAFQYALKFYPGVYAGAELRKIIGIYFGEYSILTVTELYAENKVIFGLNIIRDREELVVEVHETEIKVVQEFENIMLDLSFDTSGENRPGQNY